MRNLKARVAEQFGSYETFAGCPRADIEDLAAIGDPFQVPAQWSFVQQGTPAHELYVITDGTARVYCDRLPIAELRPGDVVGEMALFGNGLRQATATSIDRLHAVRIGYHDLAAVLHRRPRLARSIRDVCQARYRLTG